MTKDSGKTNNIFSPQAKLLWHGINVWSFLKKNACSPVLFEIALTGYCNANCPWCFFKDKVNKAYLDTNIMLNTLDDIVSVGAKAINWTGGGEPTIHLDFDILVEEAYDLGLKQGLFTNSYIEIPNQDMFSWIRISLTDRGYDAIVKPKVPFGICLNQVADYSESYLRTICKTAQAFGADYFQIRPALSKTSIEQPEIHIPYYLKEYETSNFKVYIIEYKYLECKKAHGYNECYGYYFCPSIDWFGNVVVCLYLMNNPNYVLGNLYTENLKSIIKKYPKFAKVIPECQVCCKNHEINKMLYQAKHMSQVDFL